ncbi:hypothetical protein FKM82_005566 [Ascaphus truei]
MCQVMRKLPVLSMLFSALEVSLRVKQASTSAKPHSTCCSHWPKLSRSDGHLARHNRGSNWVTMFFRRGDVGSRRIRTPKCLGCPSAGWGV